MTAVTWDWGIGTMNSEGNVYVGNLTVNSS